MRLDSSMTDEVLLQAMGQRLAQLRLAKNLTQQRLAEQAGLGLRTVQRLELGEAASQLSSFVRVCRVLGIVTGFDVLLPEQAASPMMQLAQLKRHARPRKRASGRKLVAREPQKKWTWGETP